MKLNVQGHLICWLCWFVTSYDLFVRICIAAERHQHLLSDVHAMLFLLKISHFGIIFTAANFMPKISIKIAWHEPKNMPTSSATSLIVIWRLSKVIFVTALIGCWRARATWSSIVEHWRLLCLPWTDCIIIELVFCSE